ncbi:MAG: hypothetical protein P9L94_02360 [Candidatus Hinthialibacter antarcticus]|nr:hypothetical protein [Candidatus Hinthialibacter antarcticus]
MSTQAQGCVAKVSFHELFGDENEHASLEKLNQFLTSVVDLSSETHGVSSAALVKIVHNNELIWLTQEQADRYLQNHRFHGQEASLRKAVEKALKGESKFIKQELQVLMTMAELTMEQCRKDPDIDQIEVRRLVPQLKRSQVEIDNALKDIEELEANIAEVRNQQPQIVNYEKKVGELLEHKSNGQWDSARKIACELEKKKNQYLLSCRAIEPDLNSVSFRRLDLQKVKKRLLSIHRYLCAQKVDGLEMEINELRSRMKSLQGQPGDVQSAPPPEHISQDIEMKKISELLEFDQTLLTSISRQDRLLKSQESNTQSVITEIACNVLKKPELDISDQLSELAAKQKMLGSPRVKPKAPITRMAFLARKKA